MNVKLEVKSIEKSGFFKGYASVFNLKDDQQDVVKRGAFKVSLDRWAKGGEAPKMLWQHDPECPIGTWSVIREDDHGLYVEGKLLLDVQKGFEAYQLLKAGAIEGLSIGYKVVEGIRDRKTQTRVLTCLDLVEISLVTFAANKKARVGSIKCNSLLGKIRKTAAMMRTPS